MARFLKHPLLVAIVAGLIGSVSTWFTFKNTPPNVSIVPQNIEVEAAKSVTFDAQNSSDSDGNIVSTEWTVSGRRPKTATSIASCIEGATAYQLTCRFIAPGTHTVGFAAVDNDDGTAATSTDVTVIIPGGYIGVVLQFESNSDRSALENAFNYGVDWTEVQALVGGKLIVLRNPDTGDPVLANFYRRSVDRARAYAETSSQTGGIRILATLPQRAIDKVEADLGEVGVSAQFIRMPAGEIMFALERGLANSSFVPLESPQQLRMFSQ